MARYDSPVLMKHRRVSARKIKVAPWVIRRWFGRMSEPKRGFRSWSTHFYFRQRHKPITHKGEE